MLSHSFCLRQFGGIYHCKIFFNAAYRSVSHILKIGHWKEARILIIIFPLSLGRRMRRQLVIQLPGSLYPGEGVTKEGMQRSAFTLKRGMSWSNTHSVHPGRWTIEDNIPKLIKLTLSNSADSTLLLLVPTMSHFYVLFLNAINWKHCKTLNWYDAVFPATS